MSEWDELFRDLDMMRIDALSCRVDMMREYAEYLEDRIEKLESIIQELGDEHKRRGL